MKRLTTRQAWVKIRDAFKAKSELADEFDNWLTELGLCRALDVMHVRGHITRGQRGSMLRSLRRRMPAGCRTGAYWWSKGCVGAQFRAEFINEKILGKRKARKTTK